MSEKRTVPVKAHIPPSMREELEQLRAEHSHGKVLSISDVLFGIIDEHLAIRQAMRKGPIRISHQRIGRRVGQQ